MAHDAVHDLTPAYALDALDERERAEYEAHLATCESCRAELASLQESASSLAYSVPAPAPRPQLRERILEQARSERSNVVALRPRRINYALGAVAAVAATSATTGAS
jgi:anti-sigma factor RsiW